MFYVPQYAPHYIQMWLSWCLHELTHHSNCITQIFPCDGHVNQTLHYASVHSCEANFVPLLSVLQGDYA